jgi:CTP:molybdopterin cytidylyltransferase MocA
MVLIFHRPASDGDPALVRVLADVRERLCVSHSALFRRAGADEIQVVSEWHEGKSFGEVLASLAPARGGLIVLSSGAVPLLNLADARRLVAVAGSPNPVAATNNRYSSDVCAVSNASVLGDLPALPSDNALPRWLEERAAYTVTELPGRERLGLDLDTPQDIALVALAPGAPGWLRDAAGSASLAIPRLDDLRALAADPHRELLVFGRSGSDTLRWLERNMRCRVRFLAEERGMRASSPLAIGDESGPTSQRGPRATLGLLLNEDGPESLGQIVAELADGAIIDSRVLMAHRLGVDETNWPSPNDRFASDLHRWEGIADPWLRELTKGTKASSLPILLGGHSLVGPGVRLLLS